MNKVIRPPASLRGSLRVPGDRSITVRAVLLGAIASGVSLVRDYLECDDTQAAIEIMRALGVEISTAQGVENVTANGAGNVTANEVGNVTANGAGNVTANEIGNVTANVPYLRIHGVGRRGLRPAAAPLFCNASGTTMRLLAGLLAGQSFASTLDGSPQLRRRPMRRIAEPLNLMGAHIRDTNDCAPLHIDPAELHGIEYIMPVASAQVKSALLLAAQYADGDVIIHEGAPTRDHTERMLTAMGAQVGNVRRNVPMGAQAGNVRRNVPMDAQAGNVRRNVPMDAQAGNVRRNIPNAAISPSPIVNRVSSAALQPLQMAVPADFSSAAFFLVASLLFPGSQLELRGVGLNPTRTGLLDALRLMGASIQVQNEGLQGGEPVGDLCPACSSLHAIEVGGQLTPLMIDEFPIFAVAATQATGATVVRDAQELRVKESNRIDGLVDELRKMGARIDSTPDGFIVDGPTALHGAVVDAYGDHRMAMALTVAGLIARGETTITGAECVSKTYPDFYADLDRLTS